jgi:hypothetical protein
MATRMFQARVVTRALERTHQLAWHGELEPYRVEAVARAARDVGLDRLDEFEARLFDRDVTRRSRRSRPTMCEQTPGWPWAPLAPTRSSTWPSARCR